MDTSALVNTGMTALLVIIGTIIVGAIGILIFLRIRDYKRYNELCIIFKKVGNNLIVSKDTGGIFVDVKTNNKRFFLKKNKVGLSVDNKPSKLNEKGQNIVFLYQFGHKNFKYLDINIKDSGLDLLVGEEDVNWALNEYEKYKRLFGTTMIEKLLPYIGIALMGLFILGMIIFVMRDIKEMLPLIKDMAEALRQGAQALAQANSGTTIIQ